MKKLKTICIICAVVFLGFPGIFEGSRVLADQWFDSYGKISWKDEKAHLMNLAIFLRRNPDMVSYIASCRNERNATGKAKAHLDRAKEYLVSELKIDAERIILVNGGKCETTETILQPYAKDLPPLKFFRSE